MSAQPKHLVTWRESCEQARAQLALMTAERDALASQQDRSDALIDTMRRTLREVDLGCAAQVSSDNRLVTLMLTRRMLLNAIQAWKGPL